MTSIQTESHTVTIDHRQTLGHMIAAGAYDQVNRHGRRSLPFEGTAVTSSSNPAPGPSSA
jgi:hypothetical protein